MQLISLGKAVDEIRRSGELAERDRWPFFFMVGAGISHPSVPLAEGVISHCRKEVRVSLAPKSEDKIKEYEECFKAAYPGMADRQRYLKDISCQPISAANFQLAQLLLEKDRKPLTNLVVTTNFDDMLTRAIRLLCGEALISDHPLTTGRLDLSGPIPCIAHVHGTYWFYDCCNLREERDARAETEGEASQVFMRMGDFLDGVLSQRSPLVLGYAGREGDVFMSALERRLRREGGLPYNLYWFVYRREQADELPEWLREHQSVKIVALEAPDRRGGSSPREGAAGEVTLAGSPPSEARERTLPAEKVLGTLIKAAKLPDPLLFKDPLKVFRDQLARDCGETGDTGSMYDVSEALRIVDSARTQPDVETGPSKENPVEKLRSLWRQGEFHKVLAAAQDVDVGALSPQDIVEVLRAVREAMSLSGEATDIQYGARLVELGDKIVGRGDPLPPDIKRAAEEMMARALVNKGFALGEAGRGEEAIAAYEEVERRFGAASEPALREQVAKALDLWAFLLEREADKRESEEAKQLQTEADAKYAQADERVAGGSFYNRACSAALRGNVEECRHWLEEARKAETLPTRRHMQTDTDLGSVRDREWFAVILEAAKDG